MLEMYERFYKFNIFKLYSEKEELIYENSLHENTKNEAVTG